MSFFLHRYGVFLPLEILLRLENGEPVQGIFAFLHSTIDCGYPINSAPFVQDLKGWE